MIKNRKVLVVAGGTLAAVLVAVLGVVVLTGGREPVDAPDGRVLVVGSSDFPESSLIAEMYAQVLEHGGYAVSRNHAIGPREVYLQSFVDGEIDVVPEYVGALAGYLEQQAGVLTFGEPTPTTDLAETVGQTREFLAGDNYDAVLTTPSPASPGPAFAVTGAFAATHGLATLSDLAAYEGTVTVGGPAGCAQMQACAEGLEDVYDLEPAAVVELDAGGPRTFAALADGTVDVGLVWSTDAGVATNGLVLLADDKQMQVVDNVTALLPAEVATPEVVGLIDKVNAALTTADLAALDVAVTGGQPFPLAALNWLVGKGLVPAPAAPGPLPVPTPTAEPGGGDGSGAGGGTGGSGGTGSTPGGSGWTAPKNRGEPSGNAKAQNWAALADCESGGNPTIVSSNGLYHGLYQFSKSTWQAQGGASVASNAPADEQTYRAQVLYDAAGSSPWPHCGKYL